nr:hypothetical protein [Tanacetum cinerariifolium]
MCPTETTKGRSSKAPTDSKTGHLKRNKDSSSTVKSNPSQNSTSTHVVTEMHKEDQQATGGPNFLGFTSEERADPQLSSGTLAFNLNKHIYSASFIIHSEFASGYNALANSTAEAALGKSSPSDFIPQQQGMNERTKSTSYDHLLVGASNIAKKIEDVEASRTIKLEDLVKLMQNVQPSFKDHDSPEDDLIIVVDDSDDYKEADKDGLHATLNIETEDA